MRHLASLAGVPFPERKLSSEQIEQARKWERRRSILQAGTEYFQQMLWSDRAVEAKQYLVEKRGISEAGIKDLGLGFLPNYLELRKSLQKLGFKNDEINIV
ncbi:hypothetical protein [Pleurocapsa sp. FMAR1]|uniref:hypothetical protein n=1 Tax=Pleurocapsa sp. FMAR1 TaxID=3040204 RepID=UPI0029C61A44|nr:hypothetical protein [Pleurocapsa sp. FMAR1]